MRAVVAAAFAVFATGAHADDVMAAVYAPFSLTKNQLSRYFPAGLECEPQPFYGCSATLGGLLATFEMLENDIVYSVSVTFQKGCTDCAHDARSIASWRGFLSTSEKQLFLMAVDGRSIEGIEKCPNVTMRESPDGIVSIGVRRSLDKDVFKACR